jgi:hypothetical protein
VPGYHGQEIRSGQVPSGTSGCTVSHNSVLEFIDASSAIERPAPVSTRLVSYLGYLASTADLPVFHRGEEQERKKKQKAGWLRSVKPDPPPKGQGKAGPLVQCFSASPGMEKGRWTPLRDRLPLLNPARLCQSRTMARRARPLTVVKSTSLFQSRDRCRACIGYSTATKQTTATSYRLFCRCLHARPENTSALRGFTEKKAGAWRSLQGTYPCLRQLIQSRQSSL